MGKAGSLAVLPRVRNRRGSGDTQGGGEADRVRAPVGAWTQDGSPDHADGPQGACQGRARVQGRLGGALGRPGPVGPILRAESHCPAHLRARRGRDKLQRHEAKRHLPPRARGGVANLRHRRMVEGEFCI